MKRLSLSARITVLLGVAAVLILGAVALAMDHMVDAEMGQRMDDGLLAQARALESLVVIDPAGLDMDDTARPRRHLLGGKASLYWAIQCTNAGMASSQPAPDAYPDGWPSQAQTQPTYVNVGMDHARWRALWFRFDASSAAPTLTGAAGSVSCAMVVMRPRGALDDMLATIDGILLLTPLLALLAVLLVSPVLVRRGLKPLAVLGNAMRGIGPQAPGQRLPVTGTRELEPLVARFNEVLARMDEGVARERQFAGALAHETRTHLAELRSLVEVEQRYPSQRPLDELLGEVGSIVGELQRTVSSLLLLTRLEAGIEGMDPGDVSLTQVMGRQLGSVAARLHTRRLRVEHEGAVDDAVLVGDRALLDIIVGNLVNNAVAYAPEGSVITIGREKHALVIANDAPDVGADEVARFGQRFWSKHHGADGHVGLGLALAGAAAAAMGLSLHFSMDAKQHLRATLSWSTDHEAGLSAATNHL